MTIFLQVNYKAIPCKIGFDSINSMDKWVEQALAEVMWQSECKLIVTSLLKEHVTIREECTKKDTKANELLLLDVL